MENYGNSGNGVRVQLDTHLVVVKDAEHDSVMFTRNEWREFIENAKQGKYDI